MATGDSGEGAVVARQVGATGDGEAADFGGRLRELQGKDETVAGGSRKRKQR